MELESELIFITCRNRSLGTQNHLGITILYTSSVNYTESKKFEAIFFIQSDKSSCLKKKLTKSLQNAELSEINVEISSKIGLR